MFSSDIYDSAKNLGDALKCRHWTVTTAESCTGGGLAYAITEVSGSSQWFAQSVVTYANSAKQNLLKVSPTTLDSHGAVSEETVMEMLAGARELALADVAIAVSGIAGPDGGTEDKPVGSVWIGCSTEHRIDTQLFLFAGGRDQVRMEAIRQALKMALKMVTTEAG